VRGQERRQRQGERCLPWASGRGWSVVTVRDAADNVRDWAGAGAGAGFTIFEGASRGLD
jgi:hypothetical protein